VCVFSNNPFLLILPLTPLFLDNMIHLLFFWLLLQHPGWRK